MPLFLIERQFAEMLEMDDETVREVTQANDEVGVNWLYPNVA